MSLTPSPPKDDPEQDEVNRLKKQINDHITRMRKMNEKSVIDEKFVKTIVRVYPADESGNREVLYLDADRCPQSAYVRGGSVSLSESW